MVRWRLKGCPNCGGDFFVYKDLDGWYEQCLQCSYRVELKTLAEFKEPVSSGGTSVEKSKESERKVVTNS